MKRRQEQKTSLKIIDSASNEIVVDTSNFKYGLYQNSEIFNINIVNLYNAVNLN